MIKKELLPLNLQFFAEEEGADDGKGGTGSAGAEDGKGAGEEGNEGTDDQSEKKFTQKDLTAIATKEKRQGKEAILKMFGAKDEKEAKTLSEAFLKWQEGQKSEKERIDEQIQLATATATENENRAVLAENKLTVYMSGVNKDAVDDALAIALLKVTEDKTLETVLEEMKKDTKYSGFFEEGSSGKPGGTGSAATHNRSGNKTENIGERLAKQQVTSKAAKSNFFKN